MKEPSAGEGWGRSVKAAEEEHGSFPCSRGSLPPLCLRPTSAGGRRGRDWPFHEGKDGCQGSRIAVQRGAKRPGAPGPGEFSAPARQNAAAKPKLRAVPFQNCRKIVAEINFLRLNIRQFDKASLTLFVEILKQYLKLKLYFVFFGDKCITHSLRGKIF